MKTILVTSFALFAAVLVACSDDTTPAPAGGTSTSSSSSSSSGSSSGGSTTSSSGSTATGSEKKGSVKVSKADGTVVEYASTGVEGTIDGDQMYFELNSSDTKQVLHLTIHGRTAGSYDFAEKGTPGKAHILFFTEDKLPKATSDNPVEWSPMNGKLTLDVATDTQAKGTYKATGTPDGADGEYTVEGSFDVSLGAL